MPLHAWIEEETDRFGRPTGLYGVYGDEGIWRYAQHAPLDIAWSMARDLDPYAVLKKAGRIVRVTSGEEPLAGYMTAF